ncbi:Ribonuclease H1, N-terminal [Dillenia turbinata]|uniref:Ribonuclease H1, N-terminal n=1 Tax=Dillenia turbinata TaxID=194707 RepID=A0AAN8VAB4_9MAGN
MDISEKIFLSTERPEKFIKETIDKQKIQFGEWELNKFPRNSNINPGIYKTWPQVLEQTTGFINPLFKGFYDLKYALDCSRNRIGINFCIVDDIRNEINSSNHSSSSASASRSYRDAVKADVTENLIFCHYSETMGKNFNILNNKCREFNKQINSQKELIALLKSRLTEVET